MVILSDIVSTYWCLKVNIVRVVGERRALSLELSKVGVISGLELVDCAGRLYLGWETVPWRDDSV